MYNVKCNIFGLTTHIFPSNISGGSRLKSKGLYWCFLDFKKAFDMVPRERLWRLMEELEVPSEYMLAISRIYEKVICCVRMSDRLSRYPQC